jgi:predicted HAD superfamily Cof-like phosphohydrolase
MYLKSVQNMVRDFHRKFDFPVGDVAYPKALTRERRTKRAEWAHEENVEFANAVTLVDQIDASLDIIYFALGNLVEMGVHADITFEMVHEANMAKTGGGKRDDGKQQKPDGWIGPEERLGQYIEAITTEVK